MKCNSVFVTFVKVDAIRASPRVRLNSTARRSALARLNDRMVPREGATGENIALRMSGEKRIRGWAGEDDKKEDTKEAKLVWSDDRKPRLPAADKWIDNINVPPIGQERDTKDKESQSPVPTLRERADRAVVTPDTIAEDSTELSTERRPKLPMMSEYPALTSTMHFNDFCTGDTNSDTKSSKSVPGTGSPSKSPLYRPSTAHTTNPSTGPVKARAKIRAFLKQRKFVDKKTEGQGAEDRDDLPVESDKAEEQIKPKPSVVGNSPLKTKDVRVSSYQSRKHRIERLSKVLESVAEVSLECSANAISALKRGK